MIKAEKMHRVACHVRVDLVASTEQTSNRFSPQSEVGVMSKGNNSQGKEKKKPKKDAKPAPVKAPPAKAAPAPKKK